MKKTIEAVVIGIVGLALAAGTLFAEETQRVGINGQVTYHGTPVCAMVLANGQYDFSCSGDGSFDFSVPLDQNGGITVQVFCSGRAPYRQTVTPGQATGMSIEMEDSQSDKGIDMIAALQARDADRCVIDGYVSDNGTPLCAMVLANGQYAFTCSGDGRFELEMPLDPAGRVTLYGFCAGKQPYKYIYTPEEISFSQDSDMDGVTIDAGDCNDLDATIHPGATDICGDGIDQDCNGADASCNSTSFDSDFVGWWLIYADSGLNAFQHDGFAIDAAGNLWDLDCPGASSTPDCNWYIDSSDLEGRILQANNGTATFEYNEDGETVIRMATYQMNGDICVLDQSDYGYPTIYLQRIQ